MEDPPTSFFPCDVEGTTEDRILSISTHLENALQCFEREGWERGLSYKANAKLYSLIYHIKTSCKFPKFSSSLEILFSLYTQAFSWLLCLKCGQAVYCLGQHLGRRGDHSSAFWNTE